MLEQIYPIRLVNIINEACWRHSFPPDDQLAKQIFEGFYDLEYIEANVQNYSGWHLSRLGRKSVLYHYPNILHSDSDTKRLHYLFNKLDDDRRSLSSKWVGRDNDGDSF